MNEDKNKNANGMLFDIVAGTSSGALSGAVLVDHFLKNNKDWERSDVRLVDFWKGLRNHTIADRLFQKRSPVRGLWTYWHNLNPDIATTEAARRFWSAFQFDFTTYGVPNLYVPVLQPNYRFLNPYLPYYWLYDYRDLRQYLSEVINFPIKTSFENGEPRLLVVSTDVQDYTSTVTFDSYQKKKDPVDAAGNVVADRQGKISRYFAEYGRDSSTKHILLYDGIGSEQLLASALAKYALDHPHMEDKITGNDRQFWDGGYLSNTPLRELLQSQRLLARLFGWPG